MSRRIPIRATVAANAKAIRVAAKLTQPQVVYAAKERGFRIDQGTVSRIERGRLVPTIDVLEALCAGLDVAPWQLLVPEYDVRNPPVLANPSESQQAFWRRLERAAKDAGITTQRPAAPRHSCYK